MTSDHALRIGAAHVSWAVVETAPHHNTVNAIRRRQAFLEAVQQGRSKKEARELLGVPATTYDSWRRTDKTWASAVDAALHQFKAQGHWEGGFADFRRVYMPREFDSPPFHFEIIRRLENAPPMSITLILTPPNMGKSSLIEDWCNYKLGVDPDHRITVVSKSQHHARKLLGFVQHRMTDVTRYPTYVGRFGPFKPEGSDERPWTKDYFTVAKSSFLERDPSMQSLGWTGQIYGARVDTMILDDIQTRDNLSSVEEMLNKFHGEFVNRPGTDGRIVIIGTRIEVGDIYERLIDDDIITKHCLIEYPAINYKGESLWAERWPVEKLDTMRKNVGEKAWWCNYMQQPQRAGDATFTDEMVEESKDKVRKVGLLKTDVPWPTVVGVDPGLAPGANAIVALSYSHDRIELLDCVTDSGLARSEEILQRIEQFALMYRPLDVVIEQNNFQRGLVRDDRLEALRRQYGFRVSPHQTTGNKLDPVMGVSGMATSFIKGELSIPWGDPHAQARMEPLVRQLLAWRPGTPTRLITQDLVMALWFAWLHVMRTRPALAVNGDSWRRRASPVQRMMSPLRGRLINTRAS